MTIESAALATVFPLLLFTSNAVWTSASSIAVPIIDYYHVSTLAANMLSLVFSIIYVVVGPSSAYLTDSLSLPPILFLAVCGMVLGNVFRAWASYGYLWLMLGNCCTAITQPFVYSNYSTVALYSVGRERQAVYIGLAVVIGSLGTAYGFGVCSYLIQSASDFAYWYARLELLYLVMNAAVAVVLAVICYRLYVRDDILSARARARRAGRLRLSFPTQSKAAIVVCVAVAGIVDAMSLALTILLEQLMVDAGFSDQQVFVAGLLFLLPCVPFPLLAGYIIDAWPSANSYAMAVYIATALLGALMVHLSMYSITVVYVLVSLYGILSNITGTICLGITNQWSQGINAEKINTAYSWLSTFLSLALTLLFSLVSSSTVSLDVFIVLASISVAASAFALWLMRE